MTDDDVAFVVVAITIGAFNIYAAWRPDAPHARRFHRNADKYYVNNRKHYGPERAGWEQRLIRHRRVAATIGTVAILMGVTVLSMGLLGGGGFVE